ncbi:hypothetical protein [Sulfurihydrogenibium subterraneum]|uniref:hypothetical protein n=1 Tax=Sulfurihydrogenibium subterraneum TaxID=171121 RepID=UPI000490D644|nr:hypothetical protein [Sulfurihydrogenibium subterraneum]
MEKKKLKEISQIVETEEGIKIQVQENVNIEDVKEIVDNCKTGKCDCMSQEIKAKISFMNFRVENGKPVIEIRGDVKEEDISQAMEKSQKFIEVKQK